MGKDATRPKAGAQPLDVTQSRNVSIYIPKKWVLLWNAFVDYMVRRRGRKLGESILEAVLFYVVNLDDDSAAVFRSSLHKVVRDAAEECKSLTDLADHVLLPGENLEELMKARTERAVQRRLELYRKALDWYTGGDSSRFDEDLRFLSDSSPR